MNTICPHCGDSLRFNDEQQKKIHQALAASKTGSVKLGCPKCRQIMKLTREDLGLPPSHSPEDAVSTPRTGTLPAPPPYPDIGWLADGIYEQKAVISDVPKALLLIPEGPAREAAIKAFSDRGYQVELPESSADAVQQMRFVDFQAVVLHTEFDPPLEKNVFHRHMTALPMAKRRTIYYLLLGPRFHTLYDLEALTHSANAVANDTEAEHLDIILKKSFKDQEALFGPYLEILAG